MTSNFNEHYVLRVHDLYHNVVHASNAGEALRMLEMCAAACGDVPAEDHETAMEYLRMAHDAYGQFWGELPELDDPRKDGTDDKEQE